MTILALGFLAICNQTDHSVFIANLDTKEVVHRIPVERGPHEAAVSPSGRIVAISNYGDQTAGNKITLIKLPEGTILKVIDTGDYKRPHGLAWKSETELFSTSEAKNALVLWDTATGTAKRTFDTGQRGSHMLAYVGNRLYSANVFDSTVSAFDLDSGAKIGQVTVGKGSEGIGISPDGKQVWTGNRADHTLSVIDTASLKVIDTLECKGMPYRVCFTPDGKRVLVPCPESGEVAVFDAKTRKLIKRIDLSAGSEKFETPAPKPAPVGVTVHPNGRFAYASVMLGKAVAVIDLKAMKVVGQIEAGTQPDGLAVSPIKAN